MPLVNVIDLYEHARHHGYRVPVVDVPSLDLIVPILELGEQSATPIILMFGARLVRALEPGLAAAVCAAHRAAIPVVIEVQLAPDPQALVRAIRAGANSLRLDAQSALPAATLDAALQLAHEYGIPAFDSGPSEQIDAPRLVCSLPAELSTFSAELARGLVESGSPGQAMPALAACRPWREVEHLIFFNVQDGQDEEEIHDMLATGRSTLSAIPGVRHVYTGRALRNDKPYRYCWLVRFANPHVVDRYRDHPDHVAFADSRFRPVAGDRISIDFEMLE